MRTPQTPNAGGSGRSERRRYQRLLTALPVRYQLKPDAPQQSSVTQDISAEGVRFSIEEPLPIHAPLRVEIDWPAKPYPIAFDGEVIWCGLAPATAAGRRGCDVGVRFVNISLEDRAMILDEVRQRRAMAAKAMGRLASEEVERRKFPRLNVQLPVTYRALSIDLVPGVSMDISGGGVRVVVNESVKPGTQIVMDVQLPEMPTRISFIAQVIWCQESAPGTRSPAEMGVMFMKISQTDQLAIMRYVEREMGSA